MSVGGLPLTHRTVLVLHFGGQTWYFAPDDARVHVSWIVSELGSKPYPGRRGETGLISTSSSI